jgi:predicted N-acetyltransferase YhbS
LRRSPGGQAAWRCTIVSPQSPYDRDLPGGLRLRLAACPQDLDAVLDCHLAAFGDEDRLGIEWHLRHRPGNRLEDVILVEDVRSHRVVSSVNLVRERWLYEGLPLNVGEAGIVGTRPEYRGRGLIRAQFEAFHALALRAGCPVTVISGVPYFYRQFGYDYVSAGAGMRIAAERIPDHIGGDDRYRVRPAAPEDEPALQAFYRAVAAGHGTATDLTPEVWRYQDGLPQAADDRQETLVLERDGAPCGFWRTQANESDWYRGAVITLAYLPEEEMAWPALHHARAQALDGKTEKQVTVRGAAATPLMRLMADLGAEPRPPHHWYVRVGDPVAFFTAIAPALERRLAASTLAGYSEAFTIDLYREGLILRFRSGRLLTVGLTPPDDKAHLRLPPEVAPMLWLGHRSLADLLAWYPDVRCKDGASRLLIEILFPQRPFLATPLF